MEKGVKHQNDIPCFHVDTWCHHSSYHLPGSPELLSNFSNRKGGRYCHK